MFKKVEHGAMDIATYRAANGLTLEGFGKLVGKSKGLIHLVENEGKCSAKLALDIERVTEGKVDAASLNDEIAQARKAAA